MKVYEGAPPKTGWYLRLSPRTGVITSDPRNFITIWSDFYDQVTERWTVADYPNDYWADLPGIIMPDGNYLIKNEGKNVDKFIFSPGFPPKIGCYIIVLPPDSNLMFFEGCSDIDIKQKITTIGLALVSDHIIGVKEGAVPDSYFCDDIESAIGWIDFPELIFPDGTVVNFHK